MKTTLMTISISLAFILGGYLLADSIKYHKNFNRIVRVKGLAEKKVKSNLAIWQLTIENKSNDRMSQYKKLRAQKKLLETFLLENDIPAKDMEFGNITITEQYSAAQYAQKLQTVDASEIMKLSGEVKVTITSTEVDKIKATTSKLDQLIGKGVQIPQSNTYFLFDQLNDIKAEMLREATINAREAAQSFAENSQANVGGIQSATQGYFDIKDTGTINDWSKNQSLYKLVRVVTNVSFFLE